MNRPFRALFPVPAVIHTVHTAMRRPASGAAALVPVFAAAAAFAAPSLPYANDFSSRTSGPVPSARWMRAAYVPGALARTLAGGAIDEASPYADPAALQDGWAPKAGRSSGLASFTVADDGGNQAALANDSAASNYDNGPTVVVHPLGNEFTNGVLHIAVDVRTPALTDSFNPAYNDFALFAPVFRSALAVSSSDFACPLRLGPVCMNDNRELAGEEEGATYTPGWTLRAAATGRASASGGVGFFGQYDVRNAIEAGAWYRYAASIDLDAGTYTATFAPLGATHPTPGSAAGEGVAYHAHAGWNAPTTLFFESPMTAETGGVAGIALWVQGIKQAADASAAPMFDNIAVSWRAPGAADFIPVYDNDFSARRYRQVEPAGATAGAYPVAPTTNTVVSSFYERAQINSVHGVDINNSRRLVPDATTTTAGSPEPVGQDGWRRFDGGYYHFTLVNPNKDSAGYGWANATVLRPTASSTGGNGAHSHGCIAAPLGTALASGKVRLYFDMMTPAKWHAPSDYQVCWAGVWLGSAHDAALNVWQNSEKVILDGKYSFGGGFRMGGMSKGGTATNPNFFGSAADNPTYDHGGYRGASRWYRFRLTADLDARTYDLEAFYDSTQSGAPKGPAMGDTSLTAISKRVLNKTGLALNATGPAAIDSVIVGVFNAAAYNAATTRSGDRYAVGDYPLFDNIRVCRVADDSSDGAEIYRCDFENGRRTMAAEAATLAAGTDRDGADRWVRRGPAQGLVRVLDAGGGDGVAVIDGVGRIYYGNEPAAYAVHPLGSASARSAAVEFAADIRPPGRFWKEGCFVRVEAGGDAYYQGVNRPEGGVAWRSEPRIAFGFASGAARNAVGQFTNLVVSVETVASADASAATATSDAAINPTHWHRFRVKAEPGSGRFAVRVFDQGATKPAASDADGTPVATLADLPLPAFEDPGMTTLGLAATGFSGSRGGGLDDPDVALFDNLSASFLDGGTLWIMR